MYLKSTYTVKFKITDRDLYEEFEEDNSAVVRFLTALLESVRYAEDWNKRVMETFSDEYWWDDEEDHGIIEVQVTFNTEGLSEEAHNYILESISMATGEEYPAFKDLTATQVCSLFCTDAGHHSKGPLAAAVWWGSYIPHDNEDQEGTFMEYEDGDAYEEYYGRITNFEGNPITLNDAYYNNDDHKEVYLEGNYDGPTDVEYLMNQMTQEYPNFKQ